MEKAEMNCYKCQKNYIVSIPEHLDNYWFFCPVCKHPMTFVDPLDKEIIRYRNFLESFKDSMETRKK